MKSHDAPTWPDALLRLFLPPDLFATVSGDLLEQYRDSVLLNCGKQRADRWYVTHTLAMVLRKTFPWAAVFAFAFVARSAFDWFVPPADFQLRSQVSTAVAVAVLLTAGFWIASRSGSFVAGVATGFAVAAVAAVLSLVGETAILALWHDPATMKAVQDSGGLDEAVMFPIVLMLPGAILGGLGGVLGAGVKRLRAQ